MTETPFSDWVHQRPEPIQQLMIAWPPQAVVRARNGVVLMVPGPGVEGTVASWFEDGTIGVEAALPTAVTNPAGETLEAGQVLRGACDPEKLEIVRYAEMPDGTVLNSDCIRDIIEEQPPRISLGEALATESAAIEFGRQWLKAQTDLERSVRHGVCVVYFNALHQAEVVQLDKDGLRVGGSV